MHLVDFHAHILPGADHGSKSVEESIGQIRLMQKNGIEMVVATPHFYGHTERLSDFLGRVNTSYETLIKRLNEEGWDTPRIYLGAEVLLFVGLENLEGLESLAIRGTKTLLLELPYGDLTMDYVHTVDRIVRKGYDVVLAHADRYQKEYIDTFVEKGVKIQLNADALQRVFIKKEYKKWLDAGAVVALGSDIHGVNTKSYKMFLNAERKISKYIEQIQFALEKLLKSKKM